MSDPEAATNTSPAGSTTTRPGLDIAVGMSTRTGRDSICGYAGRAKAKTSARTLDGGNRIRRRHPSFVRNSRPAGPSDIARLPLCRSIAGSSPGPRRPIDRSTVSLVSQSRNRCQCDSMPVPKGASSCRHAPAIVRPADAQGGISCRGPAPAFPLARPNGEMPGIRSRRSGTGRSIGTRSCESTQSDRFTVEDQVTRVAPDPGGRSPRRRGRSCPNRRSNRARRAQFEGEGHARRERVARIDARDAFGRQIDGNEGAVVDDRASVRFSSRRSPRRRPGPTYPVGAAVASRSNSSPRSDSRRSQSCHDWR